MSKKKIVHILNSVGGVDVSLRLILKNLNSSKFQSFVIHGEADTDAQYFNNKEQKVKDHKIPIQRNISLFKDIKAISKTISILKGIKPDLIHAHSAKGGIIGKVVGFVLKVPVLHTPQAYSYLSAENNFKRKIYLFIEKCFRVTGNKILASSKSEQNRAIREVGYKEENTLVFNNSINPITKIEPLSINKIWPNNYICSVGRPSYQKNIELMLNVLLEVKKTIKNIHLVLMGVGFHSPNLKIIKEKIKELDLEENVTLLKWTTRDDIFNIIKDSQLYISTARYEGLPYSVIESLALSKAIVATDSDGNRDLVKNNYNGFLVQNEDSNVMANSIIEMIESEEKRELFSKNSLALFNEKFNITNNISFLEEIYDQNLK